MSGELRKELDISRSGISHRETNGLEDAEEQHSDKDSRSSSGLDQNAVAVKADDAEIPKYLWDERVILGLPGRKLNDKTRNALENIRTLATRFWQRRVLDSYLAYMRRKHGLDWAGLGRVEEMSADTELRRDVIAGLDGLTRTWKTDWWEWLGGSRLFFWRWPENYQTWARDGVPVWVRGRLPPYKKPQRAPKPEMAEQVREKVSKARGRGYIRRAFVASLTRFFGVPKGDEDIQMVYDGTQSGLNDALWAPTFGLPTINSHLCGLEQDTYMCDNDLGEMFLNFQLDPSIQPYCGVDLTEAFPEEASQGKIIWERWTRNLMGFKPSPYNSTQGMGWAEEVIQGDREEAWLTAHHMNPLRWDSVRFNLPGDEEYEPNLPWVSKVRSEDGRIAADFWTYIDDVRNSGPDEEECWRTGRRVASICSYLGIQDAARKRRPPTRAPGAWAGTIIKTKDGQIVLMVDQKKWDKTRNAIRWLRSEVDKDGGMDRKKLESIRGFLIYISRTYPAMVPYLKGLHHTLDGWRPRRNDDGWKLTDAKLRAALNEGELSWNAMFDAPSKVHPVAQLRGDIEALEVLTKGDTPPERPVRPKAIATAGYGFVDAAGAGYGSSIQAPFRRFQQQHQRGIHIHFGLWSRDLDSASSNHKELLNLVETIKKGVQEGHYRNMELFISTDNFVTECAFFNGNSSSRTLFELML